MYKRVVSLVIAAILLLSLILITAGCTQEAGGEAEVTENYVPVEVQAAVIDNLSSSARLRGRIATDEEVSVLPKAAGIVEVIEVKLGDRVEKDAVLFRIEQRDIQHSLEQAQNSVSLAAQSVEQASNGLRTAQLNYELTQDQLEIAKANLERTQKLFEEGAVSAVQLEQAEMAASEKPLEIAQAQVNQAEIAYQQALNQKSQAEIGYEQVKSSYDNTVVTAPIAGVVSGLNVKVGQIVGNSQPAVVIVDTGRVYIQVNVVENMVNRLQVGQAVSVTVPSAGNEVFSSAIDYISPTADARTQLYPVKIYIENPSATLKPGMNGEVLIDTEQVEGVVVIKSNAVLERNGVNLVYVVEDDRAVERTVVLGLDTGDYVEIGEGVEAGEQVIVSGQHYVEPGQQVKVVEGE